MTPHLEVAAAAGKAREENNFSGLVVPVGQGIFDKGERL